MRKITEIKTLKNSHYMNKRGVLGMDTVRDVFVFVLILAVIGFAIIVAMATLKDSTVLDTGSFEKNKTTDILNNVTSGVNVFFENTGTIMSILVAVVIILAIVLIIVAVQRFGGSAASA